MRKARIGVANASLLERAVVYFQRREPLVNYFEAGQERVVVGAQARARLQVLLLRLGRLGRPPPHDTVEVFQTANLDDYQRVVSHNLISQEIQNL